MSEIIVIYIVAILVLLIMSAFFAGAETGITSSSRGKIHRLSNEGDKRAKRVERLLKKKSSVMGAILLGNNVVNIMSSAIATSLFIKFFGETGVLYATLIMTLLIVIFSEIAPKTYALKNSERVALASSSLLLIMVKIFSPLTAVIDKIIYVILCRKDPGAGELMSDFDEIRGTIELKHQEGSIFKYDKDMMSSILDLRETDIGEIIIHRKNIVSIDIDQDLSDIISQAFKVTHTRIPLWKGDGDNIVSILNMRKLIKFFHESNGDFNKISLDQITSKPWFVPETNSLRSQLFAFRKEEKRMAIVIDEYGALVGIVTLEDILEEIVGSIADRDRVKKSQEIIKVNGGYYKIFGEVPIRDINRELNWNLPDDDDNASTLAGLVIAKIERIPDEKEKFEFDGFSFKIFKKEQNRIISLKVKKN